MSIVDKHVDSPYGRTEMYTGHVVCCRLLSHGEYADGTDRRDGQTQDRYITLSARRRQRDKALLVLASVVICNTQVYLILS